ncbi:unnamed protein product [Rodentolepis nana]|uniref:Ovule protein n=1 Tax=Rodentolepis nana TaxID=102285 RepID=A0A0R3T789_RODNA|nr:unnamed protein product [Rodentolepis nana]
MATSIYFTTLTQAPPIVHSHLFQISFSLHSSSSSHSSPSFNSSYLNHTTTLPSLSLCAHPRSPHRHGELEGDELITRSSQAQHGFDSRVA